jgi:hypothetical protein
MSEMPRSPGRPRKGRVKRVVYLDPAVAEAAQDFAEGANGFSDALNKIAKRGLRLGDGEKNE